MFYSKRLRCFMVLACIILAADNGSAESSAIEKEAVQKADQFASKTEYQKAIAILEPVFERNPGNAEVKARLNALYSVRAEMLSKQGLLNQAIEMLERIKMLELKSRTVQSTPQQETRASNEREELNVKRFVSDAAQDSGKAVVLNERAREAFTQALEAYHKKEFDLARKFLQEGIRYEKDSAFAYEVLGDVEYFSQNLKGAQVAYNRAHELKPSESLQKKLDKLNQEIAAEVKSAEYADEHFLIRYKRDGNFAGSEIRQMLRDAYRDVSRDLGYYLHYKTVVILYSHADFAAIAETPHWSGALYDGKIRIPTYDRNTNEKHFRKLIQHELTHVFVTDISNNNAPIWLQEGLAQFQENKIIPVQMKSFADKVRKKELLTFEELSQPVSEIKEQDKAILYYYQSFLMTKWLIEKYRWHKMKEFLVLLGNEKILAEAFQQVYGFTVEDFNRRLRKEIAAEFSS